MSFNLKDQDENQPHAFVVHYDGEKECVPLGFVFKFPVNWRSEGWNKNYLYKVFWSPIENDSPTEMLKRVPEIPVIEKGDSRETPGYYRASVELVKGTTLTLAACLSLPTTVGFRVILFNLNILVTLICCKLSDFV